ncbi:addiction module antidote protein, HigA family [bacterium]|nr:addiction module antidote protein, HigA family [bacterium]
MQNGELDLWRVSREEAKSPGEFIRKELENRGWGQADLARITNRPLPTVNEIIQGKRQIMPEMAVALGIAFKTGPAIWMKREMEYRLSKVDQVDPEMEKRARLYDLAPIKEMQKRRWIAPTKTTAALELELCKFFGVVSIEDEVTMAAATRQRIISDDLSSSQTAWLFRAAHVARMLTVGKFDPKLFTTSGLELIRKLAARTQDLAHVPRVLAELGIRLVVVEPISKTYIDGAAFWLDGNPLCPVIVLSLRYDRIDWFWHTLAHELMHIKNGDKQSVDSKLVGETRHESTAEIEARADKEGADFLVPKARLDSFIRRHGMHLTRKKILTFSKLIGIHEGVVNGQLQHVGEIAWSANRDLLVKVRDIIIASAITDGYGHTLPISININS